MTPVSRRASLMGALLCGTCLAIPIHAQNASTLAERYQLDANHVDRITGSVVFANHDLSLGQDDNNGLSLVDYFGVGPSFPSSNNWNIGVYTLLNNNISVLDGSGVAKKFIKSGTTFTPQSADAGTLTSSGSGYVYYATNGTKIVYDIAFPSQGTYLASQVVHPDGFTALLTWSTVTVPGGGGTTDTRLQAVSSSNGYQLHFDYQSDTYDQQPASGGGTINGQKWHNLTDVIGINTTIDYCDPAAGHCGALTQAAPTVEYAAISTNALGTSVTDPLGRVTTYLVNYSNNTFSVQLPGSSSANYVYTFNGTNSQFLLGTAKLIQASMNGVNFGYSLSTAGTLLTTVETDPLGHTDTTVADQSIQQVTSRTNGNGFTTAYQYNAAGSLTLKTLPEGNSVAYVPDARGNVTQTTMHAKSGSGLADIVTSAVYPTSCTNFVTCNVPSSATDARGNVTNYTYDPTSGLLSTVTSPAVGGVSPQTRYTYSSLQAYYKNSAGAIVASGMPVYKLTATSACRTTASCTGAADEVKTTITYGTAGTANNLLPTSQASGAGDGSLTATSSMTYDSVGNAYTATDPLGNVTRYRYDADRELVGLVGADPDGVGPLKNRAQRTTYNAHGLVTLAEQGTVPTQSDADWANFATLQQVATAYDGADRKIQESAQAGGTTYAIAQYSYDAAGRVQCGAQRMNPAVFSSLPSSACTLGTSGSYGPDRITYDTYDNANQLLKTTSGYGVTTANGFPATLQRDEWTATYSKNGKQLTLADAKNNLTTYVYDGFDRLSQTQYPSPTAPGNSNTADYEQLGYDAASNITSRRLRDGNSLTYGYDALNRLASKTRLSTEPSVSYTYDNLGHPSKFKQGNSSLITFGFDALGRETSEAQPYGTMSYQYDLAGNRIRLTWSDGIYVTFDYDAAHEMTAVHENGGTVVVSLTYDDLGRRATRTYGSGAVSTYNYDAISRLTSIALSGASNYNTTTLSNYSPAGEIGSKANTSDTYAWTLGANANRAYTTNGLNQYTAIAGSSVGYDAKGNVTSLSGLTYTYSSENLLTSINTSTPTNFYYDALNRLAELDDSTAKVRFVYDGDNIVQEVFLNGTVARRYVPGPLHNETLVWYDGAGTGAKRYFDQDERGSTTRVSNQSGTSWSIDSYDEYGTPGSSNSGRFEYTGYALMDTAGIYYAKARMYSPAIGRFLQTDPIGYGDGPNWYNYVHSNPVSWIDPTGTDIIYDGDGNAIETDPIVVNGDTGGGGFDLIDSGVSTLTYGDTGSGTLTQPTKTTVPQKPKPAPPAKRVDPCDQVAQESGSITVFGVQGTAIVGGGVTGSVGHFHNNQTGSYGDFFSVGGGIGGDIGGGVFGGYYSNISNLTGFSVTANATYGTVSPSFTLTASNPIDNGTVAAGLPGAGLSLSASGTRLFSCHVGR